MKVLLIGGGGREHALAWKLAQSPLLTKLYCAPGNPGIAQVAELVPLKATQINELRDFAVANKIDLTIVGPEAPLILGLRDEFEKHGLKVYGPKSASAQLEGSKAFSKKIMADNNIPTAEFKTFTDYNRAVEYAQCRWNSGNPVVVKASGEALGKGAIVPNTLEEALDAIERIMVQKELGDAGSTIIIEDRLTGPEASIMAFCDGVTAKLLQPSQDFKRAYDNGKGPNTGGMGSYSPISLVDDDMSNFILETVINPTMKAMTDMGSPYIGTIYPGILLQNNKPFVLEYNCRFGDPETQCLMPLLETDLLEIFKACVEGNLKNINISWKQGACVCVVMASGGYPGSYQSGYEITGLEEANQLTDTVVFHAGTKSVDNKTVTAGGRVLGVTAWGTDVNDARVKAYKACELIKFEGGFYRADIALV